MTRDYTEQDTPARCEDDECRDREQTANFEDPRNYYLSGLCNRDGSQIPLQTGETLLKRFTIESCLGRGRFASVYLACDDVRSTKVALKVVPLASESAARRAMREIRLNSEVSEYKHIVRIHDIHPATHKGVVLLLISMEHAEDGSLRDWLVENRDDVRRRQSDGIDLLMQACHGVLALHNTGIVHKEGIVAIAQGRLQGALASFERVRQLNPGLPIIVEAIDFVRDVKHHVETTRALIDAALEQGNQQKAMFLAGFGSIY